MTIFKAKFTEYKTVADMKWDVVVPGFKKRGFYSFTFNEDKTKMFCLKDSIIDIEASDKEEALNKAKNKALDWAGSVRFKEITIIEEVAAVEEVAEQEVTINDDSKVLSINTSAGSRPNYKKILEIMDKKGATHVKISLYAGLFLFDRDLVEKLAARVQTKREPLKILNSTDAENYLIDMQASGEDALTLKEYNNSTEIKKYLVELSLKVANQTISSL